MARRIRPSVYVFKVNCGRGQVWCCADVTGYSRTCDGKKLRL